MYSLRAASEDDFEFIFELNKKNMRNYVDLLRGWDNEVELLDMRHRFRPGFDQIIVVGGTDVGRLVVDRQPDRIELRHIEILPDYQNRGIGTAIIEKILDEARGAGLPTTLMVLDINPATRLYSRLGFKIVETLDMGSKGIKYRMTRPS